MERESVVCIVKRPDILPKLATPQPATDKNVRAPRRYCFDT